jgi:chorismate-pyruvate lyase
MMVLAPISVGELVDKITILEIKLAHARTLEQTVNIRKELVLLVEILESHDLAQVVETLRQQLAKVNQELWDIEDHKRSHEKHKVFDDAFIALARNVYIKNDQRAVIKRQINTLCHSDIVEEKLY